MSIALEEFTITFTEHIYEDPCERRSVPCDNVAVYRHFFRPSVFNFRWPHMSPCSCGDNKLNLCLSCTDLLLSEKNQGFMTCVSCKGLKEVVHSEPIRKV